MPLHGSAAGKPGAILLELPVSPKVMPELPEVETMVRGIRQSVEGRVISEMRRTPCRCRPIVLTPGFTRFSRQARGRTIVEVFRRAKRCLLRLDSGSAIVIEPRMTGLMLLSDPPDPEHLRLEWKLSGGGRSKKGSSLWFWDRRGLGTVSLLNPEELHDLLHGSRLGPDALDATTDHWKSVCGRTVRPIKVLMLDQKVIAGIGNLYASEILFRSAVHPELPANRLSTLQVELIGAMTLEVLQEAIRYEGSTLSDGTYRNAMNQSGNYQNAHRVYDREGESCLGCGREKVVRIIQAQRSTFFCPRCQKSPRSR